MPGGGAPLKAQPPRSTVLFLPPVPARAQILNIYNWPSGGGKLLLLFYFHFDFYPRTGMVGLAFFVTGLGWSGLALFLSNRAGLERAGPGWQLLTKTGLQGFSLA